MKEVTPAALSALAEGDMENFIAASTPGGVEAQEARGQKTFVNSSTLPKEGSWWEPKTREILESFGIVFGEEVDDLFINVTLPEGWRKEATDHSMWSKLLDDKGRERASIFYKAAFYDRKAHVSLARRFNVDGYFACDKDGNPVPYREPNQYFACIITDAGKEIHRVGIRKKTDYATDDEHEAQAIAWLNEHYPDWKNPAAYWE